MVGPNFYTFGIGFAVPKGSPWLEDITRVVLEMKENGSISRLEKMYFDKKICRTSTAKDLSIINFSGLFFTVAITIAFCFFALVAEVVAIFVLVRFSQHLGAIGKFSMRLLFDVKKGEEHLITLKYSSTMTKKRNCVKMDLVRIENSSPDVSTPIKMQGSSTTTAANLEDLQPGREGFHARHGYVDSTLGGESFELNLHSSFGMSPTNSDFHNERLSSEVTCL